MPRPRMASTGTPRPLGLYEWRGSRDNNIAVDPAGTTLTQIVRDERDEDPARRYKGLFTVSGIARYPAVSPTASRGR